MTWLTRPVVVLGGGWSNLTVLVLAFLVVSVLASARFTPQVHRYWRAFLRHRARRTNGGTVATAALEKAIADSFALGICILCSAAAILAAHRERATLVPLLAIPVTQLVRAEVSDRIHRALMRALEKRYP